MCVRALRRPAALPQVPLRRARKHGVSSSHVPGRRGADGRPQASSSSHTPAAPRSPSRVRRSRSAQAPQRGTSRRRRAWCRRTALGGSWSSSVGPLLRSPGSDVAYASLRGIFSRYRSRYCEYLSGPNWDPPPQPRHHAAASSPSLALPRSYAGEVSCARRASPQASSQKAAVVTLPGKQRRMAPQLLTLPPRQLPPRFDTPRPSAGPRSLRQSPVRSQRRTARLSTRSTKLDDANVGLSFWAGLHR